MNYLATLTIVAVVTVLAVGMITAPVFADSNQIKQNNKAHINAQNNDGAQSISTSSLNEACSGSAACQQ